MLRKKYCFLWLLGCFVWGQICAQKVAVKTNSLYWLTTSLNAGVEAALGNRFSAELVGAYNPWVSGENAERKARFWMVQPEFKYWFCETYEGHFVGVHLHGAQYFAELKDTRYDGYLAGAGVSYGYDWILSPHWNLEAEIGLGYARLWYKQSPRIPCIKCFKKKRDNYWGPTRVALSVSYIF